MLSSKNRLTKKRDFQRILGARESCKSRNFVVKKGKAETEDSRLGIVVSAKVSKSAVKRNKLKRWIREIWKEKAESMNKSDSVIIALPPAASLEFDRVKEDVLALFNKAKITKE